MKPDARTWTAALFGFGAGLFMDSLLRIATALYWPGRASLLPAVLLLGAAAGASLFFLFIEGRKGARGADVWAGNLWVVSGFATAAGVTMGGATFEAAAGLTAAGSMLLAMAALGWRQPGEDRSDRGFLVAGAGAGAALLSLFPALNPAARAHPVPVLLAGLVLACLALLLQSSLKSRYGAALLAGALLAASAALLTHGRDRLSVGGASGVPAGSNRIVREAWPGRDRIETAVGPGKGVLTFNRGMARTVFSAGTPFRSDVPFSHPPDGKLDVLALGLPRGDMMTAMVRGGVWHDATFSTVVEPNRDLLRIMRASWPELDAAAGEKRVDLRRSEPRSFLEKGGKAYDVIILDSLVSPEAYEDRALAFREDYLRTVGSFRRMVDMLEPGGTLIVRGEGTGRAALTLRQALEGNGAAEPADAVIVVGRRNRPVSRLYYRPAGFGGGDVSWMRDALRKRPGEAFYYPRFKRYRYYELLGGENPKGLAFVTPQDFAPPTDDRPFFRHLERVRISPSAPALPEERSNYGPWGLQFIPPGDGMHWRAVLVSLLAAPFLAGLPLLAFAHRTGLAKHAAALLWPLFLGGAALSLSLRAVLAAAARFDSAEGAVWAAGLFMCAAGAAWVRTSRRLELWRIAARVFTVTALAAGAAGGMVAGALAPHAAALLWGALFVGAAAGGFAGGLLTAAGTVLPRAEGLVAATFLTGAALAWPFATLAAVSLGFSAVWLTTAAAAAGAVYTTRSL